MKYSFEDLERMRKALAPTIEGLRTQSALDQFRIIEDRVRTCMQAALSPDDLERSADAYAWLAVDKAKAENGGTLPSQFVETGPMGMLYTSPGYPEESVWWLMDRGKWPITSQPGETSAAKGNS